MKYNTTINDQEFQVEILDEHHIRVAEKVYEVDFESVSGQPVYSLLIDGHSFEAYVYPDEDKWQVLMSGQLYLARVEDEREKRLHASTESTVSESLDFHLKAPMPGLVVQIPVTEGQQIEKGQVLVILESMKMQNELKSPRAGIVQRIRVKSGESVEQRQTLLSVV